MVNLDSLSVHRKYDPSGMLSHLKHFPEQCHSAWNKVVNYGLPSEYEQINKVVILGMGGSAIGGEVVSNLLATESSVPVWVHRDFDLPRFVDDKTLVIAVSYSGNTEETLSAVNQLLQSPAKKLILTSGGKLGELAEKENIFFSIIDYPAPPRATFPYTFASLVGIFNKLGLLSDTTADMQQAITTLTSMVDQLDITVPTESNRAKQLAQKLHGNIIVTYGAGVLAGVARRWKTQFNENSKNWAFFEIFPELIHNAIVGYTHPLQAKKHLFTVLLRGPSLHPRVKVQYEMVTKILEENQIPFEVVDGVGDNLFIRVLGLILLGDFTSYYLAILNRADPTPVPQIDLIKQYMSTTIGE
ncbi:MAG: bifunctional phosphoglucose/phosphomannose isomerase [Dehalococcoidia bacterium]|nr:bifunctional phosphoglucose/phosphomannose isomerase [Dehalococcoidia bacterium]